MFGAVFIILVVACANVANLLMARAWSRQREFAIRTAMGASRGRLVRQVFTESVLLAVIGGALATAVGRLTLKILVASRPQSALDFEGARLEPTVLAWCFGLAVCTGIVFGLAPAFFVSAHRVGDSLKNGTRAAAGSAGARRTRGALVIAEVALSAVLLVASGLLLRSVVAMSRADIGVTTQGLWGVSVNVAAVGDSIARQGAFDGILKRVRAVPGVQNATIALGVPPYFGIGMNQVEIEGRPTKPSDSLMAVNMNVARSDIFSIAGIRIVAGRPFTNESRPVDLFGQTGEIVVNETFAKRFFPDGKALGGRVRRGPGLFSTIVGIAADVVIPGDQRGARTKTQFYSSIGAAPRRAVLLVRSRGSMAAMLPSIEAAVHEVAPLAKVSDERTSESFVAAQRSGHRFLLMLLGTFAGLALLLAAFGLHAVISYAVHQRTREIGVRVALGAQASDVSRMIVGQGLRLSVIGIVLGTAGGWFVARTMRALLYDVGPNDPVTMSVTAAMLVAVAVLASYAPARRALRIDPVDALRSE
jgi:predicted permease